MLPILAEDKHLISYLYELSCFAKAENRKLNKVMTGDRGAINFCC